MDLLHQAKFTHETSETYFLHLLYLWRRHLGRSLGPNYLVTTVFAKQPLPLPCLLNTKTEILAQFSKIERFIRLPFLVDPMGRSYPRLAAIYQTDWAVTDWAVTDQPNAGQLGQAHQKKKSPDIVWSIFSQLQTLPERYNHIFSFSKLVKFLNRWKYENWVITNCHIQGKCLYPVSLHLGFCTSTQKVS